MIFGILVMLFFSGCKDIGSPEPMDTVDPRVLGDWFYLEALNFSYPAPDSAFRGIRITEDGIYSLGIETATGKVALRWNDFSIKVLRANEGIFVVQYSTCMTLANIDTLQYFIESNTLTLTGSYPEGKYYRTHLGDVCRPPLQSTFTLSVDSVTLSSPRVSTYPPAFIEKGSSSSLQLYSNLEDGSICITIYDFTGTGIYAIGQGSAFQQHISCDVVAGYLIDSLGTMTIDLFDESSNQCSGSFEFTTLYTNINGAMPAEKPCTFRGTFSVPVYQ